MEIDAETVSLMMCSAERALELTPCFGFFAQHQTR
jgi:hypothetical protein